MAASRRRRIFHRFLVIFWSVAFGWMFWNMQARDLPEGVLITDSRVSVERADGEIRFTPAGDSASTGLVFYPGALADPEAYAPLLRGVAEAGYKVVLLELPYRLAPFDSHKAELSRRTLNVVEAQTGPNHWVVGGHSKGGKLAAEFAGDHPDTLEGLLLIGTSHPRERDLSGLELAVVKIHASEDGLASVEEIQRFAPNLPAQTEYVLIDGGNHAGFGFYGRQLGDGAADIDRREQMRQTLTASLSLMRSVD